MTGNEGRKMRQDLPTQLQLRHILRMPGVSVSLQVIPQHLYWIKVWALWAALKGGFS